MRLSGWSNVWVSQPTAESIPTHLSTCRPSTTNFQRPHFTDPSSALLGQRVPLQAVLGRGPERESRHRAAPAPPLDGAVDPGQATRARCECIRVWI
eukprot:2917557-Rhodomonas_salina.2